MALLEAPVAIGFAAGLVGTRYVTSAAGSVLRPMAKLVVRGALGASAQVRDLMDWPPKDVRSRDSVTVVAMRRAAPSAARRARASSRTQGRPRRSRPARHTRRG
jgi:hypothetical protein